MTSRPDTTLPPASLTVQSLAGGAGEVPALILLWSRHEPHRTGEAILVPDDGSSAPWTFGRGEASFSERRLALFRQRPGALTPEDPLECPRISRAQLRLSAALSGALTVENAGRVPLSLEGRDVDRAEVHPGEVLELRNELLLLCVTRATRLPAPSPSPPLHPFGAPDAHGLVGESPALWALRGAILGAARRPLHALVLGPSGSGKELIARAIHAASDRSARPLVARNAATLPEGILDAELFGNLRNYPNPGTPERAGLIGQAHGSTLFLDEFAELPAALQAHLLRVLDEGEYQRLGEATARRSDFRLVAATNRPEEHLKHDVLARLKLRLVAPGLDERREDIPLLAAHLLRGHAAADPLIAERFFPDASPRGWPRFAPALVEALVRHRYTTHLRELDGLLLASALESSGKYLELTPGVRRRLEGAGASRPPVPAPAPPAARGLFTGEEQQRLMLQRRHRFSATDCGRDPAYPGNRQTADLHLRQLACKALQAAAWDVGEASALLAGGEEGDLRVRARDRVVTFLSNLERRLAGRSPDEGRRALLEEWRGSADALLPLLDALQQGLIRGAETRR
jgi:two-component system nitrogen regulation response regulator GlnG/two-component system response regulator HydG